MAGLTPAQLFDALEAAIAQAVTARRWWHGRHRPAVWFTTATITIGDRQWYAVHLDAPNRRYGYTLPQARAMRAELLPILAAFHPLVRDAVRFMQPAPVLEDQ